MYFFSISIGTIANTISAVVIIIRSVWEGKVRDARAGGRCCLSQDGTVVLCSPCRLQSGVGRYHQVYVCELTDC